MLLPVVASNNSCELLCTSLSGCVRPAEIIHEVVNSKINITPSLHVTTYKTLSGQMDDANRQDTSLHVCSREQAKECPRGGHRSMSQHAHMKNRFSRPHTTIRLSMPFHAFRLYL